MRGRCLFAPTLKKGSFIQEVYESNKLAHSVLLARSGDRSNTLAVLVGFRRRMVGGTERDRQWQLSR